MSNYPTIFLSLEKVPEKNNRYQITWVLDNSVRQEVIRADYIFEDNFSKRDNDCYFMDYIVSKINNIIKNYNPIFVGDNLRESISVLNIKNVFDAIEIKEYLKNKIDDIPNFESFNEILFYVYSSKNNDFDLLKKSIITRDIYYNLTFYQEKILIKKKEAQDKERRDKEERERLERVRQEKEKRDKEERERLERIRLDKERSDREERERLERIRLDKERSDREERERLERVRQEKERRDKEERERLERIRLEKERRDKERNKRKELLRKRYNYIVNSINNICLVMVSIIAALFLVFMLLSFGLVFIMSILTIIFEASSLIY
jgi:hypothetical protein